MSDESFVKDFYGSYIEHYENLFQSGAIDKEEYEKWISIFRIQIKKCEYRECNHLWVSLPSEDETEERLIGCVKCGLTNRFIKDFDSAYNPLNEEEKASFEHMTTDLIKNLGMHSGSWSDLELGKAIYKKIIEAHPDATNEDISNYLSYALWKMRTKDQTQERKASRIRRLGLDETFDAWNPEFEEDIDDDYDDFDEEFELKK